MERNFYCPVCGEKTLKENPYNDTFEVCPNCNWGMDSNQNREPDLKGYYNKMSLNEAKQAYKEGREIY